MEFRIVYKIVYKIVYRRIVFIQNILKTNSKSLTKRVLLNQGSVLNQKETVEEGTIYDTIAKNHSRSMVLTFWRLQK